MKQLFLTATAASIVALGTPALAQTGNNITAPPGSQQNTARDQYRGTKDTYVSLAGSSDLFEIESSRLALERSQNADIRAFAQMMIDAHSGTTDGLMAAARDLRMNPQAPRLAGEQARWMDRLKKASDADFDRTYVDVQTTAHRTALSVHRQYADHGDAPQLREHAKSVVPAVEQHLAQVSAMKM